MPLYQVEIPAKQSGVRRLPGAFHAAISILVFAFSCPAPNVGAADGVYRVAADFTVAGDFSSRLPLLVIDFDATVQGVLAKTNGRVVEIAIVDNVAGRPNAPTDEPVLRAWVELNPAKIPEGMKTERTFKLLAPGDGEQRLSMLGMPESGIWTLLGSNQDKSMLRNYLAVTLAAKIRSDWAPEVRYCEVLHKIKGRYVYEGLFLLSEYLSEGVWKAPRALKGKSYLAKYVSPILAEGGVGEPAAPRFEIVYPDTKGNPALAKAVESDLLEVGAKLDSKSRNVFMEYVDLVEENDFIAAYILNEVFLDHEPNAPFYWIKYDNGRIGVSPLWNFDQSLDNAIEPFDDEESESGEISYPWFSRLLLSVEYVENLKRTYYQLRRGVLDPDNLDILVEDTVVFLGPALQRDWFRWRQAYAAAAPQLAKTKHGETLVRETHTADQEVLKIKHFLRLQDDRIKNRIMRLRWQEGMFASGLSSHRNIIALLVFLAVFFGVTGYVRRRM